MWIAFIAVVICIILLDLGIFTKPNTPISTKDSIKLSLFYIAVGCLFGIWIWCIKGFESSAEYYAAFFTEKALAVDNIFLISVIFGYCGIAPKYQHKVLMIGIISVIILRAIMIYLGIQLIDKYAFILYIFGIFLIYTGIQIFMSKNQSFSPENSPIVQFVKNRLPISTDPKDQDKMWIHKNKKIIFTNQTLALVLIEVIDIIMAVDSIPAVLAITNDIYVIYTSNIFAILGLRALYFCVANLIKQFVYLKHSLGILLIFIGSKIFIAHIFGKIPAGISLFITFIILLSGVLLSLMKNRDAKK